MSRELEGAIGLAGPINLLLGAASVAGTANQLEKKINPDWEKWENNTAWEQIKQLLDPDPNNLTMINFIRACTLLYQNSPSPFERVTFYIKGATIQVKAVRFENPMYYQMYLIDPLDGKTALISQIPEELKEWLEEVYPGRQITEEDVLQAVLKKAWPENKKDHTPSLLHTPHNMDLV